MMTLVISAMAFGHADQAMQLLKRTDEAAGVVVGTPTFIAVDRAFVGYRLLADALAKAWVRDDVAAALSAARGAEELVRRDGAGAALPLLASYVVGVTSFEAGQVGTGLEYLGRAFPTGLELGNEYLTRLALVEKAEMLAETGSPEGPSLLRAYLNDADALRHGYAQCALARFFISAQDPNSAEKCLPNASEVDTLSLPILHRPMLALHALVRQARGALEEAVALAGRAAIGQERSPMRPLDRSHVLLTHARCLKAAARHAEADEAIRLARDRLNRMANGFSDVSTRDGYLMELQPNARTLALAKEWLREG
jgi:hypothetical protein